MTSIVVIQLVEGLGRGGGAGEDSLGAGDERSRRHRLVVDHGDGREVAEQAEVFGERPFDDVVHEVMGRIEVADHALGSRTSAGSGTKTGASPAAKNRPRNALDGFGIVEPGVRTA